MEMYQLWMVIASSATLISAGIGWVLTMAKSTEKRTRILEIEIAVLKAIIEERKK